MSKLDVLNTRVDTLTTEVGKLEDLHLKAVATIKAQEKQILGMSLVSPDILEAKPAPQSNPIPALPKIPALDLNKDLIVRKEYCFFTPNEYFKYH